MLFEAPVAQAFAQRLYELGVLASGFFYPVVPQGQARVRTQMSAAHTRQQLERALGVFEQAGRELGVINKKG
jgi:glycine C-acetyltransferase